MFVMPFIVFSLKPTYLEGKKLADIFGEGEKKLGCFVYGNI